MEAIRDPHRLFCGSGRDSCAGKLPEEGRHENSHFNHDQMRRNTRPGATGERLEFVLYQSFALFG